MFCSRCLVAPATCEVMILAARRGYPRVVLCARCNQEMIYEEAGNASRRLLTVFDGPTVLLTREQTRRIRFLLHLVWENDADPDTDVVLYDEATFERPADGDHLIAAELARIESPIELHYYALNLDQDGGEAALRAVLDHPLCDVGTALMIYWLAQPDLRLGWEADGEALEYDPEGLAFIKQVQERLINQDFANSMIRFDPRCFLGVDFTVPDGGSTGMHLIPAALKEASPGRELDYIRF